MATLPSQPHLDERYLVLKICLLSLLPLLPFASEIPI
jgi:uncharacterized membrane protein